MDEGREKGEVLVSPLILGGNRVPVNVTAWTVRDSSGAVVFETIDPADLRLYLGSRSEH